MTVKEKTGGWAAPLLPRPPSPPPTQTCYGVPAAAPAAATAFQDPYFPEPSAYVLLPVFRRRRRRCGCFRCCGSILASSTLLSAAFFVVVLLSAAFFLWPSDPELTVSSLHLDGIRVFPPPTAAIDVSLGLDLRVRNPDFFALDYRSIAVSIGYRGRQLGSVTAQGGHIRARGFSQVQAELNLDGLRVLNDVIYLIEDLASGSLPLETVTEIDGRMRLFFLDIPVKGKISCAVTVNPETQEVISQDCYPE